jgi:hypothetical protein
MYYIDGSKIKIKMPIYFMAPPFHANFDYHLQLNVLQPSTKSENLHFILPWVLQVGTTRFGSIYFGLMKIPYVLPFNYML